MPVSVSQYYRNNVAHYIIVDVKNTHIPMVDSGMDLVNYYGELMGNPYEDVRVVFYADYDDRHNEYLSRFCRNNSRLHLQLFSAYDNDISVDVAISMDLMWIAAQSARGRTVSRRLFSVVSNDKSKYHLCAHLKDIGMDAKICCNDEPDTELSVLCGFLEVHRMIINTVEAVPLPTFEVVHEDADPPILDRHESVESVAATSHASSNELTPVIGTRTLNVGTPEHVHDIAESRIYGYTAVEWYNFFAEYGRDVSHEWGVMEEDGIVVALYEYSQFGTFVAQHVNLPSGKSTRRSIVHNIAIALTENLVIEPVQVIDDPGEHRRRIRRMMRMSDRVNRTARPFCFIEGTFDHM